MNQAIRRIAWIGTGVMGAPMAGHLLAAGFEVVVHSRTRSKAEELLGRGALWADSARDAADGADAAFSIVGNPEDVEATHLGSEGTLAALRLPRILVDMTTSRPSLAVRLHEAAKHRGVDSIDAPVSGGDVGARNATLSIMLGGDEEPCRRVTPILEKLGKTVIRQGGPGAGQHTKMVNQILIASGMMGACEGMLYASRAGLDPTTVIASVGSGAAGSWAINNLGPRMVRRDFGPGFYIDHFLKDLGIALDEASRMGIVLPGLAQARQLYEAARAQGLGRQGSQALLLVLERLCGLAPIEAAAASPQV